jgi:energy-coupling factor transporter ATP-binding protein EcfA2
MRGFTSPGDCIAEMSNSAAPSRDDAAVRQGYLDSLAALVGEDPLYIERKFISDEKWRKYSGTETFRYSGVLREQEPNLKKLLVNRHLVIVGEPGSGKSTIARAVARLLGSQDSVVDLPIMVNLRSYRGDLKDLYRAQIPSSLLESRELRRHYILDGLDEVPREALQGAFHDVKRLVTADPGCQLIITSRQAFYAEHATELGPDFAAFHLLDFDGEDLRSYAALRGLDPQTFIDKVFEAGIGDEVRNPLNAYTTTVRLLDGQQLSPLRSDNILFVVDQLLASRPVLSSRRQRRAVQLIAVGMEIYSRNELLPEEAIQILAVGFGVDTNEAQEILNELLHSILLRTPQGIVFQLRSYGELLAALELQNQPFDRIRRLSFLDSGLPNPSWLNTISLLAEMHVEVRRYFIRNYPEWMLDSSPAAFNAGERSSLVEQIVTRLDNAGQLIMRHPSIKVGRLVRFLTDNTAERLVRDLHSSREVVQANALVVLGVAKRPEVLEVALPIALDVKRSDYVRYSAIVAVTYAESPALLDQLIAVLARTDPYYDPMLESIGMNMTDGDIERVMPSILATGTLLGAVFQRFRDMRSKAAVASALRYIANAPGTVNHHRCESYLEPVLKSIPEYCDDEIIGLIIQVFIAMEVNHIFGGADVLRYLTQAVEKCGKKDEVCSALIQHLLDAGSQPRILDRLTVRWMTVAHADHLVETKATELIKRLATYIPVGPVRERLSPYSEGLIEAQEEYTARYDAEQKEEENKRAERVQSLQQTIAQDSFVKALGAFYHLKDEIWPELPPERVAWLAEQTSARFVEMDLQNSITFGEGTSWSQPVELETLLKIVDRYALQLERDDQLVLSLRAWSAQTVSNYFLRHGFSDAAKEQFVRLVADPQQRSSVIGNSFTFLGQTAFAWETLPAMLTTIMNNPNVESYLNSNALGILIKRGIDDATLRDCLRSSNHGVRDVAFEELIQRQDRATISRELARLISDQQTLLACEAAPPYDGPAAWITKVRSMWAWDDLKRIRRLTLRHQLPYFSETVTSALRKLNVQGLPDIIRTQLLDAPESWRQRQMSLAIECEREGQIAFAREVPFKKILELLKTSTSLITLKVFVEGRTDLPIYAKLLHDIGEHELADGLDVVGGWPNLSGRPVDRWLDGCREAVIIMDGDVGRDLSKRKKPYTPSAKKAFEGIKGRPIQLYVLERYGIENYFTRTALEKETGRDLGAYWPLPVDCGIEDHLVEHDRWIDRHLPSFGSWLRRRGAQRRSPFYSKSMNANVASSITNADLAGTDLARILKEISEKNSAAKAI